MRILIAGGGDSRRAVAMGAKYLPTIKDLKASQRFQQKQNPLPKFKKAGAPSARKRKGK